MTARTKIKFEGEIGSNNPRITKEILMEHLLKIEQDYNASKLVGIPLDEISRIHITCKGET